jgi:hypothetical protein
VFEGERPMESPIVTALPSMQLNIASNVGSDKWHLSVRIMDF